jgi:hypothetical protein
MFLHISHVQWQTVSWIFGKYGFNGNMIRTIIGQQNIDGYRIWQSSVAGWEIPLSKSRFLAGKINYTGGSYCWSVIGKWFLKSWYPSRREILIFSCLDLPGLSRLPVLYVSGFIMFQVHTKFPNPKWSTWRVNPFDTYFPWNTNTNPWNHNCLKSISSY